MSSACASAKLVGARLRVGVALGRGRHSDGADVGAGRYVGANTLGADVGSGALGANVGVSRYVGADDGSGAGASVAFGPSK